jgi:hypothetical protein
MKQGMLNRKRPSIKIRLEKSNSGHKFKIAGSVILAGMLYPVTQMLQ